MVWIQGQLPFLVCWGTGTETKRVPRMCLVRGRSIYSTIHVFRRNNDSPFWCACKFIKLSAGAQVKWNKTGMWWLHWLTQESGHIQKLTKDATLRSKRTRVAEIREYEVNTGDIIVFQEAKRWQLETMHVKSERNAKKPQLTLYRETAQRPPQSQQKCSICKKWEKYVTMSFSQSVKVLTEEQQQSQAAFH